MFLLLAVAYEEIPRVALFSFRLIHRAWASLFGPPVMKISDCDAYSIVMERTTT